MQVNDVKQIGDKSKQHGRWIWPVWKFWTFTPWGWVLAIVWNACEICRRPCPFAPWVFGVVTGMKGRRVKHHS